MMGVVARRKPREVRHFSDQNKARTLAIRRPRR